MNTIRLIASAVLAITSGSIAAETEIEKTSGFPPLGNIKPRSAAEISGSSWSIGGETLDRDYAVYENYKRYVGPLGAKHIRLQAGWAKCEQQAGVYSWGWLDDIINDAKAQGVQPWVELNYGNPIYPGGGDTGLGGGFPSSPEALAAWDRWARALVECFKDRVHTWEIWNEPDINRTGTATVDAYVNLYIRTADIIRSLQPKARICALALAGDIKYADTFLAGLQAKDRLDLADIITIHGYPRNPDDTGNIRALRGVTAKYKPSIEIRQGETGAPSKYQENFALSKINWTENTQAKWNLRRMLAHYALDVPFNLFTISDMHYTHYHREQGTALRMNYKGLLGTNPDKTISHAKPAYHAAQNVFTIFDDSIERINSFPHTASSTNKITVLACAKVGSGDQVVTLWFSGAPPLESNSTTAVDIAFPQARFKDPVLADLLTGLVYSIPETHWSRSGNGCVFRRIPIYDSPIIIAEKSLLGLLDSLPR